MSTQPNPGGRLALQAEGDGDHLLFGDDPQLSLTVPSAVMAKLVAQVNEGVKRLSSGGLEVGGLLVGPKGVGGTVVVDDIIPLPIEYRFGPSFQMSVFDLPNIATAMESVQGDPTKAVVGFYRSRRRDSRTLRESDHEIFAAIEAAHKSFGADFRCCFILAPTSESEALACIAMRNGNGWDEMQPYTLGLDPPSIKAFPTATALQQLTRNLSAEPLADLPVPAPPPQPVAQNSSTVAEHAPDLPAPSRSLIRRARIWMYALAGVIVLWTASVYLSGDKEASRPFPTIPTNTATPRLGFSATFESPVWRLSWNRAAMDDLKAVGAVLSIQDGPVQQQIPLAPADLASGTIFYTPQSGDLSFGLRVDRGGSYAEEHVRVLGAPSAAQKAPIKAPVQTVVESQVVPPPPQPNKPAPVASAPKTVAVAAPAAPVKPEPSSPETAKASPPERDVQSLPAPVFQPMVVALATPVPPVIDLPPAVIPTATPTAPPVKQPVKQVAAAPPIATPPVALPAPASSASSVPAPAKSNYVGPRPIQQVSPQMPANTADVSQVQVLVEINDRGKVTKVTPIAWNARNAPMMALAVRAAAFWVFEPAQLNGRGIASQMTLTFRVNAPAR